MQTLLNDFSIFFTAIWNYVIQIYNWIINSIVGELIIFTVIISLFFFIIYKFNEMKN